ncbi:MAG: hypothetical protein ACYTBJ_25455 [Planctomycetota bacterium]|jgi:hypothetical protein
MADEYPDGENLLTRITEIQAIIATTSAQSFSPANAVDNLPFWLNNIRALPSEHNTYRQSTWQFEVPMVLFRETYDGGFGNQATTIQIWNDIINTLKQFRLRPGLESTTYSDPPLGYKSDSLTIESDGYIIECRV